METKKLTKYQRAKRRVAKIRGFYNHLAIYLIVNIVLFLMQDKMTFILLSKRAFGSPDILERINWDVWGTPIIWGVFLVFHAIKVFGGFSFFGRNWEEKKIKKIVEADVNYKKRN